MIMTRNRDRHGIDRLHITDPLPEELMAGELLRAIWSGRSMPWAWRDIDDPRRIRLSDDYGTRLTYEVVDFNQTEDVYRLQWRISGPGHHP